MGSDGYLTSIDEVKNIYVDDNMSLATDPTESSVVINGDSIVSMTLWGFHPSIFVLYETAFRSFLENTKDLINDEFYIPLVIDLAIRHDVVKPKLFPTTEKWKGVTYADDLDEVKNFLAELTVAGLYPESRASR